MEEKTRQNRVSRAMQALTSQLRKQTQAIDRLAASNEALVNYLLEQSSSASSIELTEQEEQLPGSLDDG